MRKLLFTLLSLFTLTINAQIFTKKTVVDKFDDTILDKEQKTLIQKNDTAFVIEEKGNKPITYIITGKLDDLTQGDKDHIVNLVDDVWGYEEVWSLVLESDFPKYVEAFTEARFEPDREKRHSLMEKYIDKYAYYIVHRVVTTKYTHEFQSELIWVQKGEHNGRTIYQR